MKTKPIKVCVASSASLPEATAKWKNYWESQPNHIVIAAPKPIAKRDFAQKYPSVHTNFFRGLLKSDILFIANEDKKGIRGYIGAEVFAELVFGMMQNFTGGPKIRVILAKHPAKTLPCYDEIAAWLKLGWIEVFKKEASLPRCARGK